MNSEMIEIPSLIAVPEILFCKRVLAIQAHYDDIDIAIGGFVSQLVKNGSTVLYVTVTDDLAGVVDLEISKDEAHQQLSEESKRAGQIIGTLGIYDLKYPDAGNWNVYEVRRDLLTIIRQFQPDCILSLDPWLATEAHSDHYKSGFAAVEAAILTDVLGVEGSALQIPAEFHGKEKQEIIAVGLYNTSHANIFIDIDKVLDMKLAAVAQYVSQFSPESMADLLEALPRRSMHFAAIGKSAKKLGAQVIHAECLKVLSPSALHAAR